MRVRLQVVQQRGHTRIADQDLGAEAGDAALARCLAQMAEQQPADAAPLHVIDDGDGRFRRVAAVETDAARHADRLDRRAGLAAPCGERHVIDAVRAQQPSQETFRQAWHGREEAEVARFRRQALEAGDEGLPMFGTQHPHRDFRPVGKPMDGEPRRIDAQRFKPARIVICHRESPFATVGSNARAGALPRRSPLFCASVARRADRPTGFAKIERCDHPALIDGVPMPVRLSMEVSDFERYGDRSDEKAR